MKRSAVTPETPRIRLGRLFAIGLLAGAAACTVASFGEQVATKVPGIAQVDLLISTGRAPFMGFGGGGVNKGTAADVRISEYQREIDAHYDARDIDLEAGAGLVLVVVIGSAAVAVARRQEAGIETLPQTPAA